MNKFLYILLFVFIFAGCGGKNFNEPGKVDIDKYRTKISFRTDFQIIWNAAKKSLQRFPIANADVSAGTIETDWISDRSDKLYSGYKEVRIPYQIRYRVTAKVYADKKGVTSVKLSIREQYLSDAVTMGDDFDGSVYKWHDIKSSTIKEHYLLGLIEKEVKKSFDF